MLKLLSFQPASLYKNGGASRVLRRLYDGKESQIISFVIKEDTQAVLNGPITEVLVHAQPLQRPWMRWKLRNFIIWLREKAFIEFTRYKIRSAVEKELFDIMHLVCHGPFTMAVYNQQVLKDKKLWVSFHDHFIPAATKFNDTKILWTKADRRLVISEQMGREYQKQFGQQQYEIITDGILPNELSTPNVIDPAKPVTIYFSGLLHNEYHSLFKVLADALDSLSDSGVVYRLIMRGTQNISFLKNRNFVTEFRKEFVSDEAVKEEMDAASILYLPIKFNDPEFYLYSMSTKMVGYLGAAGSILYHGPAASAANLLLKNAQAAVSCTSLDKEEMISCLQDLVANKSNVSARAKALATERFDMLDIRKRFWED